MVSSSALRPRPRATFISGGNSPSAALVTCDVIVSETAAITVRMVPSRGSDKASCAYSLPLAMAWLKVYGVKRVSSPAESLMPWKNCATIAPELPRDPSSRASAILASSVPRCLSPSSRNTASTEPRDKLRLVPVSPSATGNTLMWFSRSCSATTRWIPDTSASAKAAPSRYLETGSGKRAATRAATETCVPGIPE